jgi:tetratricopeptide (TPR) repeat protein
MLWLALPSAAQTAPPTSTGQSTSRPHPEEPPLPPDAPNPDQGSTTVPESKSRTKRVINKLDPHCINIIFHTCWSSPTADPVKPVHEEEKQYAENIEVGYFYLQNKNYIAAESRLKEALELKPESPDALIGLAQAQQKQGKRGAARQSYEAYLKLKPDGPDAEKVKKALAELK